MKYDFDESVSRRETDSLKWDGMKSFFGRDDLMPLWVADMDFRTPPFVIEALRKRLEHEILGYSLKDKGYYTSIINWVAMRYGWEIRKEWIHFMPGVVPALALAINYYTKPGDKVLVQPPIYHPFHLVPSRNHRTVVWSPLRYEQGILVFDAERFKRDVQGCKLFILCNPHNPGGKVWERKELEYMAEVCRESGTLVISDEIHADLTFSPFAHVPFASVSEAARMNSITLHAPSKVFNMPGMASAHAIIPNSEIREEYYRFLDNNELANGNLFSSIAVTAAYTHGTEWLEQMLDYVSGNIRLIADYCKERIPLIRPILPQASYLVFLDCRELGLPHSELIRLFEEKAGLALSEGSMFGKEGEGFMRLNAGCPRSFLIRALGILEAAVEAR